MDILRLGVLDYNILQILLCGVLYDQINKELIVLYIAYDIFIRTQLYSLGCIGPMLIVLLIQPYSLVHICAPRFHHLLLP